MATLSVSAHDIDAAGLAVDADLPPEWLAQHLGDVELTLTSVAPAHVTARLSRSGDDIVVRGRVRAELTTPCARCLAPAPVHVDAELSLFLKPDPAEAALARARGKKTNGAFGHDGLTSASKARLPEAPAVKAAHKDHKEVEYEFGAEEADQDTYDGETVNLDPFVREAILLEVPNFPLCSEACPGIRPAASEPAPEPAVDPRLAPLGALRAKLAAKRPSSKAPGRSSEPPRAPQKKKNKE
jgi:uncharacterized protein